MRPHWSRWRTLLVALATLPFLYPFVFLVSVALRPDADYISNPVGLPTHLTLSHLDMAWSSAGMGPALLNSVIVVIIAAIVTTTTSATAAFWLLRHRNRWSTLLITAMLLAWMIPFIIYLLPLFIMLSRAGLIDNVPIVGVIYGVTNIPFGVYLCHSYFEQAVPLSVRQAAEVDGAGPLRQFLWVVVPLARPALATIASLVVIWSWGDLLLGVIMLQEPSHFTVTVAAATLTQRAETPVQLVAAAALISMIPVFLVFATSQRALVRGLTAGIGK